MRKLDFLSKILCCCDAIFEIKYPRGQSEDLHSYPLPILPTFTMIGYLENHRNVKNTKKSISQEQNRTFYQIKKFLTCTSDEKFWEFIIL